jgi:hypothetical protein
LDDELSALYQILVLLGVDRLHFGCWLGARPLTNCIGPIVPLTLLE